MTDPVTEPIRHVEPVCRPPSETDSLIRPVTHGCDWNEHTRRATDTAPSRLVGAARCA